MPLGFDQSRRSDVAIRSWRWAHIDDAEFRGVRRRRRIQRGARAETLLWARHRNRYGDGRQPVGRLLQDLIYQGGVDQSLVKWVEYDGVGRQVRNGLNFTERGFGVRAAVGCSDRGHTAISQAKPGDFDWDNIFGSSRNEMVPYGWHLLWAVGDHAAGRRWKRCRRRNGTARLFLTT